MLFNFVRGQVTLMLLRHMFLQFVLPRKRLVADRACPYARFVNLFVSLTISFSLENADTTLDSAYEPTVRVQNRFCGGYVSTKFGINNSNVLTNRVGLFWRCLWWDGIVNFTLHGSSVSLFAP